VELAARAKTANPSSGLGYGSSNITNNNLPQKSRGQIPLNKTNANANGSTKLLKSRGQIQLNNSNANANGSTKPLKSRGPISLNNTNAKVNANPQKSRREMPRLEPATIAALAKPGPLTFRTKNPIPLRSKSAEVEPTRPKARPKKGE
jgi:hypothetical protein